MSNNKHSNRYGDYFSQPCDHSSIPTTKITSRSQQSEELQMKTSSGTVIKHSNVSSQFDIQSDFDSQEKSDVPQVYNKNVLDLQWNYTVDDKQERTSDDPILSQKMNQVSQSTPTDTIGCLMKNIQTDIEKIPDYLTKNNQSFQQMLDHIGSNMSTTTTTTVHNTYNKDALRKIAILIYKIMIINHYHLLWTAYLKSGLGELIVSSKEVSEVSYATTIPIWPKQIKAFVSVNNITKKNENVVYSDFVNQQLNELQRQLKIHQDQLQIKIDLYRGYTQDIQKIIETYIEQHLRSFGMKIEHEIELVRFDYLIRALKLEYLRHNPNQYQEQLMTEVCGSKYEQETTEQEYHFLKQQISYHSNSSNQSFQSSPLGQSTTGRLINLVPNVDMRQQLFQQFKVIAEQARNDLFEIYMKSAEEERKEYRKKYEDNLKKMWSAHRRPIDQNHTISQIMIQFINQRCQQISERIQCIYKFKAQTLLP